MQNADPDGDNDDSVAEAQEQLTSLKASMEKNGGTAFTFRSTRTLPTNTHSAAPAGHYRAAAPRSSHQHAVQSPRRQSQPRFHRAVRFRSGWLHSVLPLLNVVDGFGTKRSVRTARVIPSSQLCGSVPLPASSAAFCIAACSRFSTKACFLVVISKHVRVENVWASEREREGANSRKVTVNESRSEEREVISTVCSVGQ